MRPIRGFVAVWLIATAVIFVLAIVASGAGSRDPVHHLRWLAGAMMVAAFPAGVAARRVVRWEGPWLAPLVTFGVVTVALGLAILALRGFIAPALTTDLPNEPASWSLGHRIAAAAEAEAAAAGATASYESGASLGAWIEANRIGWEVQMTIVSPLIGIAFAWIGALLAAWLPGSLRREVRHAILWGAGLFLFLTGYLMTENGYELLLVRTVGPASVTAWFPLLAPGMLALGLLIPTLARLAGVAESAAGRIG